MPDYLTLLFDADQTLFDFDRSMAQAFRATYLQSGAQGQLPYKEEYLALYARINHSWWRKFEREECSKAQLQTGRFADFFAALHLQEDADAFNRDYLNALGDFAFLLPGAKALCSSLAQKYSLYIITNGVAATQRRRFEKSDLKPYFKGLFISEDAGFAKPRPEYFDYVFRALGQPEKKRTLVIGDSLTTDMQGAANYGLDACWYNPGHLPNPNKIPVRYEIDALQQLCGVL